MAVHDLRKKTNASTGQRVVMDPNKVRMSNLENRINNQEQKLDKIIELQASVSYTHLTLPTNREV